MLPAKAQMVRVRTGVAVSITFLPSTLPDETGYDTENNRGLETGWHEVSAGLTRMLLGNGLQLLCIGAAIWLLFGFADVNRMMKGVNGKADWNLIVLYAGTAAIGLTMLYSYWVILVGQWTCLAAPERRNAKALIFASLLCILASPVLTFLAGWTGGMEAVMAAKHTGAGKTLSTSDYLQLAGGILGMAGSVLFILFLRACAVCFESKPLVWASNLYLALTVTIILAAVAIGFNLVQIDMDPKELSKGFKRGELKVFLELGLVFYLIVASLISYVWYLVLLWLTKACIDNGVKSFRSPLAPQSW
jgi:hypothetical protein